MGELATGSGRGTADKPVLSRVINRAAVAAKHTVEGASQVAKDTFSDTVATISTVLRDVGVLPEPEQAPDQEFRSKLEAFQTTIRDRIVYIEEDLSFCPEDYGFTTQDETERNAYAKVKDTIGFTDGLHWIRLAAKEENPGPEVQTDEWLRGRIEDYTALLTNAGLRPDAAQLINIGLIVHCRLQDKMDMKPMTDQALPTVGLPTELAPQ